MKRKLEDVRTRDRLRGNERGREIEKERRKKR